MRKLGIILLLFLLAGCWPTSVSFVDGKMDPSWKTFYVTTLDNKAPNTPLSYSASLSELIKDGVQNNTRLLLDDKQEEAQVHITGTITNYSIIPVLLQEGDNAEKNRLTVTVQFEIFISEPEEDQMNLTASRFVDYEASTDLATVEGILLDEINEQIVQDVINKLMSNW